MVTEIANDPTQNFKTERLTDIAYGYKQTGTLLAAIELGVFTAISEGARTGQEIAAKVALPEESIDRLLTVCKALDLVCEVDGAYHNLSDVERYLVKTRPTYFGDYLLYQAKEAYDKWKDLVQEIHGSGASMPEKRYKVLMHDPEEARRFTVAGYNSSISLAHRLAKMFDFRLVAKDASLFSFAWCQPPAPATGHPSLAAMAVPQRPAAAYRSGSQHSVARQCAAWTGRAEWGRVELQGVAGVEDLSTADRKSGGGALTCCLAGRGGGPLRGWPGGWWP
jgi:hypothetical protein